MATTSPEDAALGDVLDRLHAATAELDSMSGQAQIARGAAGLALELTGSTHARLTLGDKVYPETAAGSPPEGAAFALAAELRAGGQVLGKISVSRPDRYTETEEHALEIFAGLVATSLDLSKTVDRLTKVDGARQKILKNMSTIVDRERRRFVTDLHDDALQRLTAAEIQLERVASNGKVDPASLDDVRELLAQTEHALRRLVFDVQPPALESPEGLAQALRDRTAMLAASGIEYEIEVDLPEELDLDTRALIFRQVAEAIGNVERHARAKHVHVSLIGADTGVLGIVQDDGQGFDVAERSNLPGHLGLLALRERALMAGGRYRIDSRPGTGTRIEFWIPLQREVRA
jgi:signal transduction histidine kinase